MVCFLKKVVKKISSYTWVSIIVIKIVPSFKTIFGTEYRKTFNSIKFTSKVNEPKLLKVTNHAISNVEHYKCNITSHLKSIKAFEQKVSLISKENLNRGFEEFKMDNLLINNFELMTTGGTSGSPTRFIVPKDRYKKEFAFYHKIWSTKGYSNELRAVIRNEKIQKNKAYKINPITKELIFDGFRNNEDYYQIIYDTLIKFGIKYIQGYPSSIYNFFIYVNKKKLSTSFIKGVFLSSEIFLKHQRSVLVETLKLSVISVYGHSEKLILAVDFNGDNKYQVIEEYGYLELLDEKGSVIKKVGELGEIVGSTFDNYGMPLLRYRTGDYSSYLQYEKGKHRILNGIQGRWQEMKIYNRDGSFVTPTALNLHDDLYNYINGLQYYQKEKGRLQVRIIPNNKYNDSIEQQFLMHFRERLLPDTVVDICKVRELITKKNGKFLILETLVKN